MAALPVLTLGFQALNIVLNLYSEAGWFTTLVADGTATFPSGTAVALVFNDAGSTEWDATVTTTTISWNIAKAAVDTLITALAQIPDPSVDLIYTPSGGVPVLWGRGRVAIDV